MDIDTVLKITQEQLINWDVVSQIEKKLDPDDINAPGRYAPVSKK